MSKSEKETKHEKAGTRVIKVGRCNTDCSVW